jgi:hypothetical protein
MEAVAVLVCVPVNVAVGGTGVAVLMPVPVSVAVGITAV